MSYQTQALALSNLLAFWPLTEVAGATTALDLGPNNLPLTYSAAKVSGVNNILGAGLGMSTTGGIYASRAVASGSTLAPTAAMTIAAWVTPNVFMTTGGSLIAGRQNHFRININSRGSFGLQGWVGGVATDTRMAQDWSTAGDTYFVVGVFTGTTFKVYVNGALVQEGVTVGALSAVADAFSVSSTTFPMDGTISGVGVWGRALNTGEIWELWAAGAKVALVDQGTLIEDLYDANPVVAAAPVGLRCGLCHGLRRSNEPVIVRGAGGSYHPGCYGARGFNKTVVTPTSGTAYPGYEGAIMRALYLQMSVHSERVTGVNRPAYFDGTRLQPATNAAVLTSHFDVYVPWALTGALIAHHEHLPAENWLIDLAISQVEQAWALQTAQGNIVESTTTGGLDFVMGQLGEAILFLAPYVSDGTLNRWKANLIKAGEYLITYPIGSPESQYYINGNREAFELWSWWMLWLATGEARWRTQYETQYAFLTAPPAHSGAADSTGNDTYGLVTVVAPTLADGSDGKGYLIERSTSRLSTITGPGGGVLSGYDPNYVTFANQALARVWLYNRDIRILRIMNMQQNLVMDRANLTGATVGDVPAWSLDGRGGSRQNSLSTFGHGIFAVLGILAGRTDIITPTILAGTFNEAVRFLTNDMIYASGLSREPSTNFGLWLMSLPTWPGIT